MAHTLTNGSNLWFNREKLSLGVSMLNWQVVRLDKRELALAYPLVRSVVRVDLDRWLRFARTVMLSEGGILGARAGRNCLYGIATFLPKPNLRSERVLEVELFAAFSLRRGIDVQRALRAELQNIAVAQGCRAVAYMARPPGPGESVPVWLEPMPALAESGTVVALTGG